MQANGPLYLSVVTPVYSGEQYLERLVRQIARQRDSWSEAGLGVEIVEAIFVLDNPVDGSAAVLQALSEEYAWINTILLSRNFGQHSATVAGILHTSGDWVVTLDEDLQHDPRLIPGLLKTAALERADVVYARPRNAVHGGGYRDFFSRWVKTLIGKLSGNPYLTQFNSFRLLRGDVARAACSISAQHTYLDVALTWYTQRIEVCELDLEDTRHTQKRASGYSFWGLVSHAKRLLFTSDFRILRFTTGAALLFVSAAALYGFWIMFMRLYGPPDFSPSGWTSLMVVILGIGGVGLFMMGLVLEFLQVLMLQLQGKPTFFVVHRDRDAQLRDIAEKL